MIYKAKSPSLRGDSLESPKQSNFVDCHESLRDSRNDGVWRDSTNQKEIKNVYTAKKYH